MEYKTVIFDLDGTLVDTLEDLQDHVNHVLADEGYPQRTLEQVKLAVGEGYRVLLANSLPTGTTAEVIDRCTELFHQRYLSQLIHKTRPYPGILDLLQELKNRGVKTGVVSNKMDGATKEVCNHFFGSLIDAAVGDTPPRQRKPAPDNVFHLLSLLDASEETTLYVGDSNIDVHTASNAGLDFVGVTWGFRTREVLVREGASILIDEPKDLLPLLKSR